MLEKIKAIINAEDFKLDAQTLVNIIEIILAEVFAFISKEEGYPAE